MILARHAPEPPAQGPHVCAEDKQARQDAFRTGGRIVSAYGDWDARLWLLTEAADDTGDRCHGVPAAG